jgi:hypothetical protein
LAASDAGIPVANTLSEIWLAPAVSSPDAVSIDGQDGPNTSIAVPSALSENVIYQIADGVPDGTAPEHTGGMADEPAFGDPDGRFIETQPSASTV